jgi:hypothetical protein
VSGSWRSSARIVWADGALICPNPQESPAEHGHAARPRLPASASRATRSRGPHRPRRAIENGEQAFVFAPVEGVGIAATEPASGLDCRRRPTTTAIAIEFAALTCCAVSFTARHGPQPSVPLLRDHAEGRGTDLPRDRLRRAGPAVEILLASAPRPGGSGTPRGRRGGDECSYHRASSTTTLLLSSAGCLDALSVPRHGELPPRTPPAQSAGTWFWRSSVPTAVIPVHPRKLD